MDQVLIIFLIKIWQRSTPIISQILISVFGFSSSCRFQPSCSQYTVTQIKDHGTIRGLWLGFNRIRSCHG